MPLNMIQFIHGIFPVAFLETGLKKGETDDHARNH